LKLAFSPTPLRTVQRTDVILPSLSALSGFPTRHGSVSKHPVNLGMQHSVLKNDGLLSSGKHFLLTHSFLQQEGRLGTVAMSTDCTDTAGISRSSWSWDLD